MPDTAHSTTGRTLDVTHLVIERLGLKNVSAAAAREVVSGLMSPSGLSAAMTAVPSTTTSAPSASASCSRQKALTNNADNSHSIKSTIMNQVTPPSGVKGSAPVSPAPKSNVAVEPGEQFYERALQRRIRSWPDVSAAGFLTVELSQYLKGTGGATAEAVMERSRVSGTTASWPTAGVWPRGSTRSPFPKPVTCSKRAALRQNAMPAP